MHDPELPLPLRKISGHTTDYIVKEYLQEALNLHAWEDPHLKYKMRQINDAYYNGGSQSAPQAEPESRKDDREIIEPLVYVMVEVLMGACCVMKNCYSGDG